MTRVDRIFFMDFNQYALVVVNLLPEPQCLLVDVDLFQVTGSPAMPSCHVEPV
jgi:hypothetical protein